MTTPTTSEDLTTWDHLPAAEAVVKACTEPGRDPRWHALMVEHLTERLPHLAVRLRLLGSMYRIQRLGLDRRDEISRVVSALRREWVMTPARAWLPDSGTQSLVRGCMPLLARALDRLVDETE